MKEGFFQVELNKNDKYKTPFRVGHKLYHWRRLIMGFINSPGYFQRTMDKILENLINKKCIIYVDDILVF